MVLHAQATQDFDTWIVILSDEGSSSCILCACASSKDAQTYADQVNSVLIPKQRSLLSKLETTQKILLQIMKKAGVMPKNHEELIIAICKIIRYIEIGKANAS